MKDPLQIDVTPYEILGVEQNVDRKAIQNAFLRKIKTQRGQNMALARGRLLKPVDRARIDVFMFCPKFLNLLIPKIRKPQHLTGKRDFVANSWHMIEKNAFPSIEATHSLAVLWYWWARYITESERIEKTDTISSINNVEDLIAGPDTKVLWENTMARWILLLNSKEFFDSFPFAFDLSSEGIEDLKSRITSHFLGLFTHYSYKYREAGLHDEADIFNIYTRLWKSEDDTAVLLSKIKTPLPKGYTCGRLFLERVDMLNSVCDYIDLSDRGKLYAGEAERLQLQLSKFFFDIPQLLEDKQYNALISKIEDGMVRLGVEDSPENWSKLGGSFNELEESLIKIVIGIYANASFEIGRNYLHNGEFEKALSSFSKSQKVMYSTKRKKDLEKELINYLSNQSNIDFRRALYNTDRAIKVFSYNALHDSKADLLKKKSNLLSNEIINELNLRVQNNNAPREYILQVVERYREVIILNEKSILAAKSKEAIENYKIILLNNLKNNYLQIIFPMVEEISKTLTDLYNNLKNKAGYNASDYTLKRFLNRTVLDQGFRQFNIYYPKDQMVFLHFLFEMRYCTSLVESYFPGTTNNGGQDVFLEMLARMDKALANKLNAMGSSKGFKFKSEYYWKEAVKKFGFFTDIADIEKRYSVYKEFRLRNYQKAVDEFKKYFSLSYNELNKATYEYYSRFNSDSVVNELSEKVIFLEERMTKNSSDLGIAQDALKLYERLDSIKPLNSSLEQDRKDCLEKLKEILTKVISEIVSSKNVSISLLNETLLFVKELIATRISIKDLSKIENDCSIKLFDMLLETLKDNNQDFDNMIESYSISEEKVSHKKLVKHFNEIKGLLNQTSRIIKEYSISAIRINHFNGIKTEILKNRARFIDIYANRRYESIATIVSRDEIPDNKIEGIKNDIKGVTAKLEKYMTDIDHGYKKNIFDVISRLKDIQLKLDIGYFSENSKVRAIYDEALELKQSGKANEALEKLKEATNISTNEVFKSSIYDVGYKWQLEILEKQGLDAEDKLKSGLGMFTIGSDIPDYKEVKNTATEVLDSINKLEKLLKQVSNYYSEDKTKVGQLKRIRTRINNMVAKFKKSILSITEAQYILYSSMLLAIKEKMYDKAVKIYREYKHEASDLPIYIKNIYHEALYNRILQNEKLLSKQDKSLIDERKRFEESKRIDALKKIKFFKKGFGKLISLFIIDSLIFGSTIFVSKNFNMIYGFVTGLLLLIMYTFFFRNRCAFKRCRLKTRSKTGTFLLTFKKGSKMQRKKLELCSNHLQELKNYISKMPMPKDMNNLVDKLSADIPELKKNSDTYNIKRIITSINIIVNQYS